jgi:hypothetical protein
LGPSRGSRFHPWPRPYPLPLHPRLCCLLPLCTHRLHPRPLPSTPLPLCSV